MKHTVYSLSSADFLKWNTLGRSNGTFEDIEGINDFIIKKSIEGEYFFEAQTEVIDIYSYLEDKQSKRNEALKNCYDNFNIYNTGYGRLPKKLTE